MLVVENVHKAHVVSSGSIPVLRGVSFELAAGETLALTGESGSGKSTLLHLIGGLDSPDSGQIRLDSVDIARLGDKGRAAIRRGVVSVIFQQFNLIPSLTVAENVAFQARLAGRHDPEMCHTLIADLGLSDQVAKYPEQLSGGQQQRVAIARALAVRPRLVLADEPTGNLDEDTASDVIDLMLGAVRNTGTALMVVTHSSAIASRLQRRLHLRSGLLA